MSSANLDIVRSIYAAWERGDFSSAEWAHAEIEFVRADGPSPGNWTGGAGMAEGTRDWLNTWENSRAEVDEDRELDAERVLVLVRYLGRGKVSGLELAQLEPKGAQLFHVYDGKVTRLVHWLDRDRAPSASRHAADRSDDAPSCQIKTRADRATVTPAHVELAHAMIGAHHAGDLDTFIEFFSPETEQLPDAAVFPESNPLHGRDEFRSWIEYISKSWTGARWGTSEVYALDGERVPHRGQWGGAGALCGIETCSSVTGLFTIRDGQITHVEYDFDQTRR